MARGEIIYLTYFVSIGGICHIANLCRNGYRPEQVPYFQNRRDKMTAKLQPYSLVELLVANLKFAQAEVNNNFI